jgi:hypothetical protein
VDPVASTLIAAVGVGLLVLALYDAIRTTIAIAEEPGLLTRLLSRTMWRGFRRLTSRTDSRLLRSTGPLLSIALVTVWVLTVWLGWSLVFASVPESVVFLDTGEPASFWAKVYFAATTMVTTGVGDFAPATDMWRVLAGAVSVSGIALVTLAITYLVPIITAAVDRYHFAEFLNSLGGTAEEIVRRHWDGEGFSLLGARMPRLVDGITRMRASHLAFPVLHFFHGADPERALAPRVAALDEALTMMEYGVVEDHRLPLREFHPVREAVDGLLETVVGQSFAIPQDEVPPVPSLEPLRTADIPVIDSVQFGEAVQAVADRRRLLLSYVLDDSWRWEEVHTERSQDAPA